MFDMSTSTQFYQPTTSKAFELPGITEAVKWLCRERQLKWNDISVLTLASLKLLCDKVFEIIMNSEDP